MTTTADPTGNPATREQRLAARLRENLRRRKAQSRELGLITSPAPEAPVSQPPTGESAQGLPKQRLGG